MLEDQVTNEQTMFILSLQKEASCTKLFKLLSRKQPAFFDNNRLLIEVSVYWVALFKTFNSEHLQNVSEGFSSFKHLLDAFKQVWTSMFTDNSTIYFSRDLEQITSMRLQKIILMGEIKRLAGFKTSNLNAGLLDELKETISVGLSETPYLHDVVLRRLLIRIYFETRKLNKDSVSKFYKSISTSDMSNYQQITTTEQLFVMTCAS